MNVLVVINPIAGAGDARRGGEALARELAGRGHAVECVVTRGPDDARLAVAERAPALDALAVAGGDGTLAEAVSGLDDPGRVRVAHLGRGTGNQLVRELAVPREPSALAALVDEGRVRRIDLARSGGRCMLAVAGVGFDGMVARAVAERRRGAPMGYVGYALPLWEVLRRYRSPRLRVRLDEAPPLEAALVIAGNVANYGGVLRVAAGARCDSGTLEVCVFSGRGRLDLVRYATASAAGRVSRLRDVVVRRAQRLRVEGDEPAPVQLDGDWRGTTPLTLELEPRRLPFVCPGGAPPRGPVAA